MNFVYGLSLGFVRVGEDQMPEPEGPSATPETTIISENHKLKFKDASNTRRKMVFNDSFSSFIIRLISLFLLIQANMISCQPLYTIRNKYYFLINYHRKKLLSLLICFCPDS